MHYPLQCNGEQMKFNKLRIRITEPTLNFFEGTMASEIAHVKKNKKTNTILSSLTNRVGNLIFFAIET